MAKGVKKPVEPANGLKRLEKMLVEEKPPFSIYLRENFERFSDVIKRIGPRWDKIAIWAENEGHTGGKPIKPATAKRAYEREKARVRKLTEGSAVKSVPVTSVKPASAKPAAGSVRILPKEEPATDVDQKLAAFRETLKKGG